MKIAVDARPLCYAQPTGIPMYLRGMLRALAEEDKLNEYFLYAHRAFSVEGLEGLRHQKRILSVPCVGTAWLQTVAPIWTAQDKADVFWGTQHVLPLAARGRAKSVLTVHDLSFLRVPETMQTANYWINRLFVKPSVAKADLVVCDSQNTARDVLELMGPRPERVRTVYMGLGGEFQPQDRAAALAALKPLLGDVRPFLLTVGTMEPRKNLATLLRAFSKLSASWPHDLYIAGPSGWKSGPLADLAGLPGLEGRVRWLGYLPQNLLPQAYAAAEVFIFPSLFEGFGRPPLEAMACGAPVVSSNAPCLPETLGPAALFVDPLDVDGWVATLDRLLQDAAARQELARQGLAWARRFRWDEAARAMRGIFEEANAA